MCRSDNILGSAVAQDRKLSGERGHGYALASLVLARGSDSRHQGMRLELFPYRLAQGARALTVDDTNGIQAAHVAVVHIALDLGLDLLGAAAANVDLQRSRHASIVDSHRNLGLLA